MNSKGEFISIRNYEYGDLDAFHEISKDFSIAVNAGWKPHESKSVSKRVLMSNILSNSDYAIVLNSSSELIGTLELNESHIRQNLNSFEIGVAMNPRYEGFGYAREACLLLMEFAFNKRKANVVEMCHIVGNTRCEKMVLSLNFVRDGIIRNYKKMFNNEIIDVVIYSMTKDEFERMYK